MLIYTAAFFIPQNIPRLFPYNYYLILQNQFSDLDLIRGPLNGCRKMDQSQIEPGDMVISLGALTVTTTVIAGAVNVSIIVWKHYQSWWMSMVAFFAVIIIWALAKIFGSLVFIEDRYIIVVKPGESALPYTIKSAIIGSMIALLVFGYAFAYLMGGSQLLMSTWIIVIFATIAIGVVWGVLSALL